MYSSPFSRNLMGRALSLTGGVMLYDTGVLPGFYYCIISKWHRKLLYLIKRSMLIS